MSEVSENIQETANFKRFLSYIYAYEGDKKLRNVGFVKAELRHERIRMQVVVSGLNGKGGKPLELCLLDERLERVPIGQIYLQNGRGEFRSASGIKNLWDSGLTYEEVCGISLQGVGDKRYYYMTLWKETGNTKKDRVPEAIKSGKNQDKDQPKETELYKNPSKDQLGRIESQKNQIEDQQEARELYKNQPENQADEIRIRKKVAKDRLEKIGLCKKEQEEIEICEDEVKNQPEKIEPCENEIKNQPEKVEFFENEVKNQLEEIEFCRDKVENQPGEIEFCRDEVENQPEEIEFCRDEVKNQPEQTELCKNQDEMQLKISNPDEQHQDEDLTEELEAASELMRQSDTSFLHASEVGPVLQGGCSVKRSGNVDKSMGMWKKFCSRYPHVDIRAVSLKTESGEECFGENRRVCETLRIRPNDIGRLPRSNWVLAHNSFLQHAYNHNHHLILFRMEYRKENGGWNNRWFLGIPGTYDEQEKVVAEVFGLRNYMVCKKGGFWYTGVNMGEYS